MTREEAIRVLKSNYPSSCYTMLREAVDLAIEALTDDPDEVVINTRISENAYTKNRHLQLNLDADEITNLGKGDVEVRIRKKNSDKKQI